MKKKNERKKIGKMILILILTVAVLVLICIFRIPFERSRSVEMYYGEEQSRTGLKRSIVSKFSVSFRKIYF